MALKVGRNFFINLSISVLFFIKIFLELLLDGSLKLIYQRFDTKLQSKGV